MLTQVSELIVSYILTLLLQVVKGCGLGSLAHTQEQDYYTSEFCTWVKVQSPKNAPFSMM